MSEPPFKLSGGFIGRADGRNDLLVGSRRRGRKPLTDDERKARQKARWALKRNITVHKDCLPLLHDVAQKLSNDLGIPLTLTQALMLVLKKELGR